MTAEDDLRAQLAAAQAQLAEAVSKAIRRGVAAGLAEARLEAVRTLCDEADAAWAAWPLTSRIRAALSAAPQPEPVPWDQPLPAMTPEEFRREREGRWEYPEPPASDEPARCADCHRPLPHTEPEQRACWAATHASGTPDGGP